jgi:hypothetical protein
MTLHPTLNSEEMAVMKVLMLSAVLFLLMGVGLSGTEELKLGTIRTWDDYIESVNTSAAEEEDEPGGLGGKVGLRACFHQPY